MKDWLLLYSSGDPLPAMARAEIHVFRSGDGARPEPGDLKRGAEEFATRLDRDRLRSGSPEHESREFVLVPLHEASTLEVGLTSRYAINEMGTLDLGPHVE